MEYFRRLFGRPLAGRSLDGRKLDGTSPALRRGSNPAPGAGGGASTVGQPIGLLLALTYAFDVTTLHGDFRPNARIVTI